ncbi:unnamed protein product, partial [Prorocentrum cordatum]
ERAGLLALFVTAEMGISNGILGDELAVAARPVPGPHPPGALPRPRGRRLVPVDGGAADGGPACAAGPVPAPLADSGSSSTAARRSG